MMGMNDKTFYWIIFSYKFEYIVGKCLFLEDKVSILLWQIDIKCRKENSCKKQQQHQQNCTFECNASKKPFISLNCKQTRVAILKFSFVSNKKLFVNVS